MSMKRNLSWKTETEKLLSAAVPQELPAPNKLSI